MYLYIENKHFILIEDVYLIIDYADFFKNKENKAIFEKYKKLDLTEKEKRTLIFTKKYIYITSYTNRALNMRMNEYQRHIDSVVF